MPANGRWDIIRRLKVKKLMIILPLHGQNTEDLQHNKSVGRLYFKSQQEKTAYAAITLATSILVHWYQICNFS